MCEAIQNFPSIIFVIASEVRARQSVPYERHCEEVRRGNPFIYHVIASEARQSVYHAPCTCLVFSPDSLKLKRTK